MSKCVIQSAMDSCSKVVRLCKLMCLRHKQGMLRAFFCHLMAMSFNQLKCNTVQIGASAIARALQGGSAAHNSSGTAVAPAIAHLDLNNVSATVSCIAPLGCLSTLQHLSLVGNGLPDAALMQLTDCFGGSFESAAPVAGGSAAEASCFASLHTLCISGNQFSGAAAAQFLDALSSRAAQVSANRLKHPCTRHVLCIACPPKCMSYNGCHLVGASGTPATIKAATIHRLEHSRIYSLMHHGASLPYFRFVQGKFVLAELQIGSNPCCETEVFEAAVQRNRERTPQLCVLWKTSDPDRQLMQPGVS